MSPPPFKAALVTGGARRIGRAIVEDLAAHGFAVVIHANRSMDDARSLANSVVGKGGRAVAVGADLTVSADVDGMFEEAHAAFGGAQGPVDLLVNNASIFEDDEAWSFRDDVFERHMTVHVKAPVRLAARFAERLPEGQKGLVVNIIDQRVWAPTPRFFSYTLSKSALWTATRTMAQAYAPAIRVNAIGPGPTLTNDRQSETDFRRQADALLLRSGPELADFGRTIRYLYQTPSITGQMIALDGGQHLAWETPDVANIRE